jgi:phage-related protein
VKKIVEIDEKAFKELKSFSDEVQAKFFALFEILGVEGFLLEPYAKRINKNICEIRVKHSGQWRALYAYIEKNKVIILSAFNKKQQKLPLKELHKAEQRLRRYV